MTPSRRAFGRAHGRAHGNAHGAMLLYAFLISTSFPVGAAITDALDPVVLTFARFLIAAAVFGGGLAASGRWRWPGLGGLLRYGAISLTMAVFFVLMFEALRWTDPISTGAIFTLLPLMTAGVALALFGRRVPAGQLAILVFGALGALWVLFDGRVENVFALALGRGEVLFALGCLSFAAYAPLIKRLHRGESVFVMTFWTLVMGTLLLGLYGWPRIQATEWAQVSARVWLGIAYLALANTAFTFLLAKYASLILPPHRVMAYTYLTPSFVIAIEAALGHAWPSASLLAGVAVTLLAMLLLQSRR